MDLLQEIIQNGNYTKLEDEYKIKMNVSSEYKFYIYNQLVLDYINAPRNIEPSTSEGIRQGSIGYFEKCKIINYCIEGIKKNIINPNNLIIGAIDECDSISALPLMAIAMRYGADINGYITVSGKGSFHILAYTIMKLKGQIDDNIVLIVLLMFSIMGANTNLEFRKNNRKINTNSIPYEETLSRFLIENGYPDFENVYDYIYNNTEDSVRKQIGVLLDNFKLFNQKDVEDEYLSRCIAYHSTDILSRLDIKPKEKLDNINPEDEIITTCINAGSFSTFTIFFDKGFIFSYFSLNRLLILMKLNKDDMLYRKIFTRFLEYAINKGVNLDLYQYNIIENIYPDLALGIKEIYEKPLWNKSCSASNNIPLPDSVKELAFSLNVIKPMGNDNSIDSVDDVKGVYKNEVCKDMYILSDEDRRESYIQSARENQRNLIKVETSNITDRNYGLENQVQSCVNFGGDPSDYNKDTLVYYKDNKDNKLYCFTPNTYPDIISNNINPSTGKKLPIEVIQKMTNTLIFMRRLNINPEKIQSFSKALNSINDNDKISNDKTNISINFVLSTGKLRGVTKQHFETIIEKNSNIFYNILNELGFYPSYFLQLSPTHKFATFCKYVNFYYKFYSDVEIESNPILIDLDMLYSNILRFF